MAVGVSESCTRQQAAVVQRILRAYPSTTPDAKLIETIRRALKDKQDQIMAGLRRLN
jgi:hypothetical protein